MHLTQYLGLDQDTLPPFGDMDIKQDAPWNAQAAPLADFLIGSMTTDFRIFKIVVQTLTGMMDYQTRAETLTGLGFNHFLTLEQCEAIAEAMIYWWERKIPSVIVDATGTLAMHDILKAAPLIAPIIPLNPFIAPEPFQSMVKRVYLQKAELPYPDYIRSSLEVFDFSESEKLQPEDVA